MKIAAGLGLLVVGTATYRITTNEVTRSGQDAPGTFAELFDSAAPFRLSEVAPNLFASPGETLDEQALNEILEEIEKMDGLLSAEPRILVHNPIGAGEM
jgi:hypothetical protein